VIIRGRLTGLVDAPLSSTPARFHAVGNSFAVKLMSAKDDFKVSNERDAPQETATPTTEEMQSQAVFTNIFDAAKQPDSNDVPVTNDVIHAVRACLDELRRIERETPYRLVKVRDKATDAERWAFTAPRIE
jgi:hypothetical protein